MAQARHAWTIRVADHDWTGREPWAAICPAPGEGMGGGGGVGGDIASPAASSAKSLGYPLRQAAVFIQIRYESAMEYPPSRSAWAASHSCHPLENLRPQVRKILFALSTAMEPVIYAFFIMLTILCICNSSLAARKCWHKRGHSPEASAPQRRIACVLEIVGGCVSPFHTANIANMTEIPHLPCHKSCKYRKGVT